MYKLYYILIGLVDRPNRGEVRREMNMEEKEAVEKFKENDKKIV